MSIAKVLQQAHIMSTSSLCRLLYLVTSFFEEAGSHMDLSAGLWTLAG
jgi:hypothetical protein